MTNQQLIDTVIFNMRKQNVLMKKCRYRSEEGLKCAIGSLIPDDMYGKEMEGHGIDGNSSIAEKIRATIGITEEQRELARRIQGAHDSSNSLVDFENRVKEIYNLFCLVVK